MARRVGFAVLVAGALAALPAGMATAEDGAGVTASVGVAAEPSPSPSPSATATVVTPPPTDLGGLFEVPTPAAPPSTNTVHPAPTSAPSPDIETPSPEPGTPPTGPASETPDVAGGTRPGSNTGAEATPIAPDTGSGAGRVGGGAVPVVGVLLALLALPFAVLFGAGRGRR